MERWVYPEQNCINFIWQNPLMNEILDNEILAKILAIKKTLKAHCLIFGKFNVYPKCAISKIQLLFD